MTFKENSSRMGDHPGFSGKSLSYILVFRINRMSVSIVKTATPTIRANGHIIDGPKINKKSINNITNA